MKSLIATYLVLSSFSVHAQEQSGFMNFNHDTGTITYREGSFIKVPEGYTWEFPHRCITKTVRTDTYSLGKSANDYPTYYDRYGKIIHEKMLDKNYVPIQEFDCDDAQFDYRNFSKVVLKPSSILTNVNLRVDIVYWSADNPKESYLYGLDHDYPYKYTATSEYADDPGYFYSENQQSYPRISNIAKRSQEVPIGYKADDSDYIHELKESYIEKWGISIGILTDLFHDYGYFRIDSEDKISTNLTIYQFRTPYTGMPNAKDLSTVFKIIVSVSKSDLIKKCSSISHDITRLESVVNQDEQYSPLIESLIQVSSESNQDIYIHYFYETQDVINKLIDFFDSDKEKYGVDGELFSENLKAISIFKKNSCLYNWDIQRIKTSAAEFVEKLNQCKNDNNISGMDYFLVNQFVERLNKTESNNGLTKIIGTIGDVKKIIEKSKVDLLNQKKTQALILGSLSGDAKELCQIAGSSNDFPYEDDKKTGDSKFRDDPIQDKNK